MLENQEPHRCLVDFESTNVTYLSKVLSSETIMDTFGFGRGPDRLKSHIWQL